MQEEEEYQSDTDDDIEVTLPRKGAQCTLESYQEVEAEKLVHQKQTELKRISNLKDMEVNPTAYFNFGFTKNDYLVFMLKQMMMRSERQVIEQEFTKFLEKRNLKL